MAMRGAGDTTGGNEIVKLALLMIAAPVLLVIKATALEMMMVVPVFGFAT